MSLDAATLPRLDAAGLPLDALARHDRLQPSLRLPERLADLEQRLADLDAEGVPLPASLRESFAQTGEWGAPLTPRIVVDAIELAQDALVKHRGARGIVAAHASQRAALERATARPSASDLPEGEALARRLARIVPGKPAVYVIERAPELARLLADLWEECPAPARPSSILLGGDLERADRGMVVDFAPTLLAMVRRLAPLVAAERGRAELDKLTKRYEAHMGKVTSALDEAIAHATAAHEEGATERDARARARDQRRQAAAQELRALDAGPQPEMPT